MNGWQRMWVVACLMMAIFIGVVSYKTIDTEERLTYPHDFKIKRLEDDLKRLTDKANANPGPWNNFGDETVEGVKEQIQTENRIFEKELSQLPSERREHVITSLSVWVGFSVSLYVAGWLIGWIYRGFRPKKV